MNMEPVSICGWDRENLSLRQLGQLKQFPTRAAAAEFAKSIGWYARDALRVHARLVGYVWIVADDHYRAVPRDFEGKGS